MSCQLKYRPAQQARVINSNAPVAPENQLNPLSEREQTDESLRVERERADNALALDLAAIDETADAVINRARARADAVLAASRAKTDREPAPHRRARVHAG